MQVHLVDGTYELFRYFYSPGGGHSNAADEQVGAVRGEELTKPGSLRFAVQERLRWIGTEQGIGIGHQPEKD